jgi:NhaA family Na+:H+ antiporter
MATSDLYAEKESFFQQFVRSEVTGSFVLLAAALAALIWANFPGWEESYHRVTEYTYAGVFLWEKPQNPAADAPGKQVTAQVSATEEIEGEENLPIFKLSLGHWVADGLMVLFFFVVGLEIKRELVVGHLSTFGQAVLPVGAAFGGAMVPAVIYFALNQSHPEVRGWGIPMATDIAFALGILSLFGKRVPIGLKVFLTALAIADDLMAVLVIAIFYTETLRIWALVVAVLLMVLLVLASRAGLRQTWIYLVLALGVWLCVFTSGVHATIAGVMLALLVPVKSKIDPTDFLERTRQRLTELEQERMTRTSPVVQKDQLEALDDLYLATEDMRPAGISLEHQLQPIQAFLILPLFALFKAGVTISESGHTILNPVSLGIILGLFFGKQIGIMLVSWLVVASKFAPLPQGVNWKQMWGMSCLGGVGFTMSIFISELAFRTHPEITSEAKIGVLTASLISGIFGYAVLRWALPQDARNQESAPSEAKTSSSVEGGV